MQTQTTKALKKIIGPIFVLDFNRSGIFHYRFKFVRQKAAVVIKIHLWLKLWTQAENQMRPLQNIHWWNFESAASVPTAKLNLGLNFIGFWKPQSRNSLLTNLSVIG